MLHFFFNLRLLVTKVLLSRACLKNRLVFCFKMFSGRYQYLVERIFCHLWTDDERWHWQLNNTDSWKQKGSLRVDNPEIQAIIGEKETRQSRDTDNHWMERKKKRQENKNSIKKTIKISNTDLMKNWCLSMA